MTTKGKNFADGKNIKFITKESDDFFRDLATHIDNIYKNDTVPTIARQIIKRSDTNIRIEKTKKL